MKSDMTLRKDYTGIDIVKFLSAFAVIAIHCRHEGLAGGREWPDVIGWFLGLAVSFFFIASGFLVSRASERSSIDSLEKKAFLRKRALNLFRIYICWLVVYIPIAIYTYVADDTVWWKAVAGYVYKAVISGHSNWAWQLWFVYSMAVVFLIYSFTSFSRRSNFVLFLLFVSISLLNYFHRELGIEGLSGLYLLTHSILGGGMCISAGVLLYQYFDRINLVATVAVSLALSIVLKYFNFGFYEFFGGIGLFLLALSFNPQSNKIFLVMRRLSMWIYYLHMAVVFAVYQIIIHSTLQVTLLQVFIIDASISFLLAYIVDYCQRNIEGLRFLGKLVK